MVPTSLKSGLMADKSYSNGGNKTTLEPSAPFACTASKRPAPARAAFGISQCHRYALRV